jgi:hypothetical protein
MFAILWNIKPSASSDVISAVDGIQLTRFVIDAIARFRLRFECTVCKSCTNGNCARTHTRIPYQEKSTSLKFIINIHGIDCFARTKYMNSNKKQLQRMSVTSSSDFADYFKTVSRQIRDLMISKYEWQRPRSAIFSRSLPIGPFNTQHSRMKRSLHVVPT